MLTPEEYEAEERARIAHIERFSKGKQFLGTDTVISTAIYGGEVEKLTIADIETLLGIASREKRLREAANDLSEAVSKAWVAARKL